LLDIDRKLVNINVRREIRIAAEGYAVNIINLNSARGIPSRELGR